MAFAGITCAKEVALSAPGRDNAIGQERVQKNVAKESATEEQRGPRERI
jgi:hypothetical protein